MDSNEAWGENVCLPDGKIPTTKQHQHERDLNRHLVTYRPITLHTSGKSRAQMGSAPEGAGKVKAVEGTSG